MAGGLALLTKAPAGYLPIFSSLVGALLGLVALVGRRREPAPGDPARLLRQTRLPSARRWTPLPTPDYVVLYVNSVQRRQVPPPAWRAIQVGPPAFVARINGLEYAWVYAVPASEPRVDGPVPTDAAPEPEDR